MLKCWEFTPERRPTFGDLVEWLGKLLHSTADYLDVSSVRARFENKIYLQPSVRDRRMPLPERRRHESKDDDDDGGKDQLKDDCSTSKSCDLLAICVPRDRRAFRILVMHVLHQWLLLRKRLDSSAANMICALPFP